MSPRRTVAAALATGLLGLVALAGAPAHADEATPAGSVTLPGEELEQSSDPDAPVPVTAGAWRGDLGPYESEDGERWYEYRRATEDSTLLVSVVSPGADPAVQDGIEVEVLDPAGDSCTVLSATDSRSDDDPGLLAVETVAGVQEAVADEDYRCLTESRLLIHVVRGSNGEEGRAPYALRVVEESPLASDAGLPRAVELGEAEAPDVDAGREDLQGGTGFEDAPEVGDGRFRGTTASDRTVVYRVPDVGWGQTLRTSLEVGPVDLAEDVFLGPYASVTVLSPMGTRVGTSGADEASLGSEAVQLAASAGPVRYLNRLADVEAPAYVPGDYYVMVTVQPPQDGPALDVDYTLEVQVDGEVDDAPDFTEPDAYLVAEDQREPVVTAVGSGGLLATLGSAVRYGGAALLAVVGLGALVAGARTLRA